ncbi:uncharacterized protein [Parasteatoda tepidariorum]|uniref:uncharacterized protein n=1 Tax=Parasteatoda tepidariorum TaxID=114398 RepID=UPI00077F8559|nr:uncharacterized protein LOC107451059 isoform X2 [Parasteatoda tepidariorum]
MLPLFLLMINSIKADVFFEELKVPSLHPRTFYLSPHQEFQVISQVLCEGLPCPEFNIIQDHAYFIQQRSYRTAKFLKLISHRLCDFKAVLDDSMKIMENFTKGANIREQKYSMTLPLLIEVKQHTRENTKNPWCIMSYAANFYTPHYWGLIATPTEVGKEFFEFAENLKIYVHTFDGDAGEVLLREIELFRRNLDTLGICYKKLKFYVAIYNVPHSPGDSRSELWFLKCTRI